MEVCHQNKISRVSTGAGRISRGISLCWKKGLHKESRCSARGTSPANTSEPLEVCWCRGWPRCDSLQLKSRQSWGCIRTGVPTALPSFSACLRGSWEGRRVGAGDSGPQAYAAFELSPRISMKGPESTSECWFTVWPPTGWTDHRSH